MKCISLCSAFWLASRDDPPVRYFRPSEASFLHHDRGRVMFSNSSERQRQEIRPAGSEDIMKCFYCLKRKGKVRVSVLQTYWCKCIYKSVEDPCDFCSQSTHFRGPHPCGIKIKVSEFQTWRYKPTSSLRCSELAQSLERQYPDLDVEGTHMLTGELLRELRDLWELQETVKLKNAAYEKEKLTKGST